MAVITLYRWCIRPVLGTCCRFHPSCSEYSLQALKKYGALKGGWLSLKRVCKCNPWCPGGYDPVD